MFGTAARSRDHAMGTTDAVFVPRWRVVAFVIAKGLDGRLRHAYIGALLDWLSDEQAAHFLRLGLVARIDADPQDATAAAAHLPSQSTSTVMRTATRPPRTAAPWTNASPLWRACRCQPPRVRRRLERLYVETISATQTL